MPIWARKPTMCSTRDYSIWTAKSEFVGGVELNRRKLEPLRTIRKSRSQGPQRYGYGTLDHEQQPSTGAAALEYPWTSSILRNVTSQSPRGAPQYSLHQYWGRCWRRVSNNRHGVMEVSPLVGSPVEGMIWYYWWRLTNKCFTITYSLIISDSVECPMLAGAGEPTKRCCRWRGRERNKFVVSERNEVNFFESRYLVTQLFWAQLTFNERKIPIDRIKILNLFGNIQFTAHFI